MPYLTPTLETLRARIKNDVVTRLPSLSAEVRNSMLNALTTAESGVVFGLYAYIAWALKQPFPDTADQEFLDRWGAIKGIERIPAKKSSGQATITGTIGSTCTPGKILSADDGTLFEVTTGITLLATSGLVSIRSVEGGEVGNKVSETTLTFRTPNAGIDNQAEVTTSITNGQEEETDVDYRNRVLSVFAEPPRGGARYDYPRWAKEASVNVTRAWIYTFDDDIGIQLGTVRLYFMTDEATIDGIPDNSDLILVSQYVESKRPVASIFEPLIPVPDPVDFTIQIEPNTGEVQAAVEAELRDLFIRDSQPNGTILLSRMREAISRATGENNNILVSPIADHVSANYEIATVGNLIFQDI